MVVVEKEIAAEHNTKDNNALKRKALEDPALLAAPAQKESSEKKTKLEVESDSEGDEFFDAASEFAHVSIESAGAPATEKPVGPIDTKYRKVKIEKSKKLANIDSCVGNFRLLISETRPILLLLLQLVIYPSVESVRSMV
jgi:hypothetical protein